MRTLALLMAGGRGERMRASGVDLPKPLVPVRGVPLVAHNLHALLRDGLRDVVVAVPASEPDVGAYARGPLAALARDAGATLEVLVEDVPLGNIGAAGRLHGRAEALLVVYADNLTSLDLGAVLRRHADSGAALTLATHEEPFRLPYGRLEVVDGRVVDYAEKPVLRVPVCSAVSVLGPAATAALPADRPTGLVDLTRVLLARGEPVAAHVHDAAWVDVNDAAALARAEALLEGSPDGLLCR